MPHAQTEQPSVPRGVEPSEGVHALPQGGAGHASLAERRFVMIGAEPNTEWLQGCLELDTKGFTLRPRRVAVGSGA